MKRLLLALVLFASSTCAMTGDSTAPADNPVVVRLKAPNANGTKQVVEFSYLQAMRLGYFEWFFRTAADNTKSDIERECAVGMIRGFQGGEEVLLPDPWYTSEILELVRRATVEVFTEPTAHTFVSNLSGDQACLLYPALHYFDFAGNLLAIIENDIAHRLLHEGLFFAQSLAPAHFEDTWTNLPACAFSIFLCESMLMCKTLLPACVLRPELVTIEHIPGHKICNSSDGKYVCVKMDEASTLSVYDTQTMQRVGRPVDGCGAGFSPDGQRLWTYIGGSKTVVVYDTQNMRQVGNPVGDTFASFSPDSQFMYTSDPERHTFALYNAQTMDPINTPRFRFYGFTQEGQLICRTNGPIGLYDPHTMQRVADATQEQLSRVLTVNRDGEIITENKQYLGTQIDGNPKVSPNNKLVCFCNSVANTVTLCNAQNLSQIGATVTGEYAGFSPDSRILYIRTRHYPGQITRFDVRDMQPIGDPIDGHNIGFSPDGQLMWVADFVDNCNQVTFYDAQTALPVSEPVHDSSGVYFRDNGTLLVTYAGRSVRLCAVSDTHVEPISTIDNVSANVTISLTMAPSQVLAIVPIAEIVSDEVRYGVCVVKCACSTNSAYQMACLAAMHRKNATEEVAHMLDEKARLLDGTLINTPAEIQKFVRAQFPAPWSNCCVQ